MQKHEQGFSAIELLIIIMVFGTMLFAGWYVRGKNKKDVPNLSPGSSAAIISEVNKTVADKYPSLSTYTTDWFAQMGTSASIPVDGYTFSLSSQNFPTTQLLQKGPDQPVNPPASETIISAKEAVAKTMSAHGFNTAQDKYTIAAVNNVMTNSRVDASYDVYKSGGTTCLEIYYSFNPNVTLSCFTAAEAASMAAKAKQFVYAYTAANPETVSKITFGPLTIKSQHKSGVLGPSHLAGYDISEAVFAVGDVKNIALYYNHLNGPWTYITRANDEYGFTCGSMTSNPTVRKIMYNQICLSATGQVRLDTNNRALQ
ncbi:MAG: hypothetical protein JWO47_412 [Candidatus Saccharibacteria bacterium]|nr:hypothetical protein [Candidatus Saccharibacteria bacterium]